MPAGRPITNNSRKAQRERERMRQVRESMRTRPLPINPAPLAKVIQHWRST